MAKKKTPPRRLVYGASLFVEPGNGELFHAESLARLAAAASAATWRELVESYYKVSYEDFLEEYEVGSVGDADAPPDYGTWLAEDCYTVPQQDAWMVAARRVEALIAADPGAFTDVTTGGGSPGGNTDQIQGPLDQLDTLAARVDPASDGFTLERDDDAIAAAFPRYLFS